MTDFNEPKRTYTYEEVKTILCEGCLFDLPIVKDIGNPYWFHTVNGERIQCRASDWKNRANRADMEPVDNDQGHAG